MGIAALMQGMALSLASDPCWAASVLTLEHTYFDDDAELVTEALPLAHTSAPAHVADHSELLAQHRASAQLQLQHQDAAGAERAFNEQRLASNWSVRFGPTFAKDWALYGARDREALTRAIIVLQHDPTTCVGDTIKILQRELAGWYRYRIGAYRLVYAVDHATTTITLDRYSSRNTVYG